MMTPSRSRHRRTLGSDHVSASSSKLSRRRAAVSSATSLQRDLDSIRSRRAKLEALTASIRLPPLIPSDVMGVYSSSVLTNTPPRIHTASKQMLHQLRKGERPITSLSPGGSVRPHPPSFKLPPLLARQLTPLHTPLPKIGQVAEADETETSEDTTANPRRTASTPSPDPQPPVVTPSPIISPISREATPGSGKRSTRTPTPVGLIAENDGSDSENGSADDEKKPDYIGIVEKMRGITSNDKTGDSENTATTTGDTTASANDTTSIAKDDKNYAGNNDAMNNDTEPNTNRTLNDAQVVANKLAATVEARKLLSTSSAVPIDEFLDAGILEAVKMNLDQSSSPDLLFESVWVITNIASGSSSQTQAVADAGFIKPLMQLFESGDDSKLKEQAVWALSNIAADGYELRDKTVEAGFLRCLMDFIRNHTTDSQLSNSTWALSNIFRAPNWRLTNEELTLAISVLKDVCLASENSGVLADSFWCLNYITTDSIRIHFVVEAGIVPQLIPHLSSSSRAVQAPAVRVTGNIVTGTDDQTDAALEAGILAPVHDILKNSPVASMRKEAAWILSNITAGTNMQIQKVIDEGVLQTLMKVIDTDRYEVLKEAAWAVTNLVTGGTNNQLQQLVDAGGVAFLVSCLSAFHREHSILENTVDAIGTLFSNLDDVDDLKMRFEEANGLEKYLELLTFDNSDMTSKVKKFLKEHFPDEDIGVKELNWGDNSDEENEDNNSLSETASKYVTGE